MPDAPEPAHAEAIEVDGQPVLVHGQQPLDAAGRAALAEVVRAAKAKMAADRPTDEQVREWGDRLTTVPLGSRIAGSLARRLHAELVNERARNAALQLRLEPPGSPRFEEMIRQLGIDMNEPAEILAEKVVEQREQLARMRPPARVITTVDDLDTLPVGAVAVDECETVWRRGEVSWFACARRPDGPPRIALPATVLWTSGEAGRG